MTPALHLKQETISLEQYEALPESRRVEVFNGIVYDMASPSQIHQALSMELAENMKRKKRAANGLSFYMQIPNGT